MSNIKEGAYKPYPKEVRQRIPGYKSWQKLVMALMFINFFLFLYCLFNWTFTWWLPTFFAVFLVVSHRYGTKLAAVDKELKKDG